MTYVIRKSFDFSASHHLTGLPADHQCARVHGHNYKVIVEVAGPLTHPGFVMDYGLLGGFKKWLDATLDHRDLNDVLDGEVPNPTAEHLAHMLAKIVGDTCPIPPACQVAVGVSETPKTWAWWRP